MPLPDPYALPTDPAGPEEREPANPVRRGLLLATLEAGVVGGMVVVNEAWIVPLLQKQLGASAQIIGLLTTVPMLMAMVFGPIVAPIIAFLGGNKRTAMLTCWVQIIGFILLALPLHFAGAAWALPIGVTLAITINAIGAVGGPAWISWMGDLIPRRVRGRYSSNRARLHHASRIGCALGFAALMNAFVADSATGMHLLLAIATLSRLGSLWLMKRQPEPPPRLHDPSSATGRVAAQEARDFLSFLKSINRTEVGRWTLVWAVLHFGCALAGPYFMPYWLEKTDRGGLGLDQQPFLYTMFVYLSTVVRLIALPVVGRLVDHFGPAAMLRIAVAGIMIVPFGWAASTSLNVLVPTEILSGLSWCTAECAVSVLLFGCSSDPQHRARLIGYHQSVCCCAIALSSLLGGFLLTVIPPLDGSPFRTLFAISIACRIPAVLLAIRYLPELKDPQRLTGLWRLIPGLQPTITLSRGVMRTFRRP